MADGEVIYEIRADDSELEGDLDRAHGKAKNHGERLKGIASGTAKAIGAGFVAAGAAATAIGVAAVNSADDLNKAMNGFSAATGIAGDSLGKYRDVLDEVYRNNYGESFADIAEQMAKMEQQGLTSMINDMDELQRALENTYLLQDTFQIDSEEGIRGITAMMKQFGISADEAYNLMAQGAQNGLNQNGDLADQLAEYSVYYRDLGFSAEEMFNALQAGAADGAYQIDYLNDAVKEFGIRTKDNSDATKQAFKALGLDANSLTKSFAQGGEASKEAFQKVVEALASCDNQVKQNEIGVALFGTKWEDLGADAVMALSSMQGNISATNDVLGEMAEIKYDDLGSMFEGMKRSVELLLIPLGEQLIPLLKDMADGVLPLMEEHLPPLVEMISEFAGSLLPIAESILPVIMELLQAILPAINQVIDEILPDLQALMEEISPILDDLISQILPIITDLLLMLIPPLMDIVSALLPPLLELMGALMPILQLTIDLLQPIIDLFMQLLDPIVQLIEGAITPLINVLTPLINVVLVALSNQLRIVMSVFNEVFNGIVTLVTSQVGNLINIFESLIDFVKNVFSGNWKAAWENVKDILRSIWEGFKGVVKAPLNAIIDLVNGFIKGINGITIPEWVPFVGGKSASIPLIPRLKGGMDFVPKDFMPAYLDYGERVLTQTQNLKFNYLGGLEGMEKALAMGGSVKETPRVVLEKGCIVVQSEIDGKSIGQAMAPYIDKELGAMQGQKERGG